jgi:hypothetical protein
VLVVHSGGKSLHGWFRVPPGTSEDTVQRFMQGAVALGESWVARFTGLTTPASFRSASSRSNAARSYFSHADLVSGVIHNDSTPEALQARVRRMFELVDPSQVLDAVFTPSASEAAA